MALLMWNATCSQSSSLFHMWRGSGWDGLGESGGTPACTVHQVYADSVCNQVGESKKAPPSWGSERCGNAKLSQSSLLSFLKSFPRVIWHQNQSELGGEKKRNANNRFLCFLFNVRFNPICRNSRDSFCQTCQEMYVLQNLIRDKRVAVWLRISGKLD